MNGSDRMKRGDRMVSELLVLSGCFSKIRQMGNLGILRALAILKILVFEQVTLFLCDECVKVSSASSFSFFYWLCPEGVLTA